ncbi:flagellar protein [bacterium]|jgi:flagellar protein FlbD|nr:flagellar protein [bacterium]
MIKLTRLSGKEFVLNCELLKFIEATPDTLLTLTTGEKIMVKESVDAVIEATLHYRQKIYREPPARNKEV